MRYLSGYLLAILGGKREPSVADIEKILGSVGIECDKAKATFAISQMKGKNVEALFEQGKTRLAAVPTGPVATQAAAPAAAAKKADAKDDKKKPAKEEEPESDNEGGMGDLFGF